MVQTPAPAKHEPPKHEAAPAKVVGQPGSLVLPLTEPAIGDKPLVGATGVRGEHIEDGERDPDTIAEEQRRRSQEYENSLGKEAKLSPDDRANKQQDALPHAHAPNHSKK